MLTRHKKTSPEIRRFLIERYYESPARLNAFFVPQEFLPPEIYKSNINIWRFIDNKCVEIAYRIRLRYNKPVTINNWHLGGKFRYSGYRPPDCPIGAKYSAHKIGKAIDIKILGFELHLILLFFGEW